jgi:hypothetical protein
LAHLVDNFAFTRINIELTILSKKIEDLREMSLAWVRANRRAFRPPLQDQICAPWRRGTAATAIASVWKAANSIASMSTTSRRNAEVWEKVVRKLPARMIPPRRRESPHPRSYFVTALIRRTCGEHRRRPGTDIRFTPAQPGLSRAWVVLIECVQKPGR